MKSMIFSAAMMPKLLDGSKDMTRRIVKPQPSEQDELALEYNDIIIDHLVSPTKLFKLKESRGSGMRRAGLLNAYPYDGPYQIGDVIYVRETWAAPHAFDAHKPRHIPKCAPIKYRASWEGPCGLIWRSPIHMPEWASRLKLRIASIKVERIKDISVRDAWREGTKCGCLYPVPQCYGNVAAFHTLWDSINGPGAWERNQYVFAYGLERIS